MLRACCALVTSRFYNRLTQLLTYLESGRRGFGGELALLAELVDELLVLGVGEEDAVERDGEDRHDDRRDVDDEEETVDAQRDQTPFQTHLLLGVARLQLHHERPQHALYLANLSTKVQVAN